MVTRSIQLSEDEASQLHEYAERTGEDESQALREAALLGLRELRLERAIREYRAAGDSYSAAAIAGMPRAAFLQTLLDHGVPLLDGPSTLADDLLALAQRRGDERLAAVARKVAETPEDR